MLRIILLDDTGDSALKDALLAANFEIALELNSANRLAGLSASIVADAIAIATPSPSREMLEQLRILSHGEPRPVIMFSNDRNSKTISATVEAGVSSYIVDGLSKERLAPIFEVAINRFKSEQLLRHQLNETQEKLSERKWIERAKGILMKQRGINEDEAYQTLRKTAMDKNMRIIDVAKQLVNNTKLII